MGWEGYATARKRTMADFGAPTFGAHIDLASFVCHLVTTDMASSVLKSMSPQYSSMAELGKMALGGNFISSAKVPDEVYEASFTQLFHERLHYWQLIGYPFFQWKFVFSLEL